MPPPKTLRIHHFYPKSVNIGDHFVRIGIEKLFSAVTPNVHFDFFNVNRQGEDTTGYGLTYSNIARANREADVVVVGGSNLYQGKTSLGIHLEDGALDTLAIPLFLVGIGTGSRFLRSHPTTPSTPVLDQIKLLHAHARFSGVRDVVTHEWLHKMGVTHNVMMGDPATFIFNYPIQPVRNDGDVLIVMPSIRFLRMNTLKSFWDLRRRILFSGISALDMDLLQQGYKTTIVCNDPRDLEYAQRLFKPCPKERIILPQSTEEYFRILSSARCIISGRLHTAVVSLSMGIPFLLINVDQRTVGFIRTYQLHNHSITPTAIGFEAQLKKMTHPILCADIREDWERIITLRDVLYKRATNHIEMALSNQR